MKIILLYFTVLCCHVLSAQTTISGKVLDSNQKELPFVNVLLLDVASKKMQSGAVTELDGSYVISGVIPGTYVLECTMVGYEKTTSAPINITNLPITQGPLTMQETSSALGTVDVVAQKSLYEKKIDRLIVNVKNSITAAGSSALDVLERSPGVVVNRQSSTISMVGKEGVVVMINGRTQYMQAAAVVDMLAGMSANNIEKLELITTPPANFDAEGNAGFINIVLIKSEFDGLNGNYALTAGGYKGAAGNASLGLNYNKGKLSLSGELNYLHNSQSQYFQFDRDVTLNGIRYYTTSINDRLPIRNNKSVRLGLEYRLKKTIFSGQVNGYHNLWEMDSDGRANFLKDNVFDKSIFATTAETNAWLHGGVNLGVQHTFKNQNQLTVNVDYLNYYTENPTDYINKYDFTNPVQDYTTLVSSKKTTPIDLLVSKVDYRMQLSKKINMETGVKATLSAFVNENKVENFENGTWVIQDFYSNYSKLNESIYAAYNSIDWKLSDKTSLKAGLRYEKTQSQLQDRKDSVLVNRDYGLFFPSVFINHNLSNTRSITVAYSSRITRPTFNDLAPFTIFMDPTNFVTGNPNLQPVISNSLKLDYKRGSVLWSVQYTHNKNTIARFVPVLVGNTNSSIARVTNYDQLQTISATVSAPLNFTKWWTGNLNITAFMDQINGIYSENKFEIKRNSASIFLAQNFKLSASYSAELAFMGNTGGFFGPFGNKPFGFVNVAFQKKFKHNNNLVLGFDNILNTMIFKSSFTDPTGSQTFSNNMIFSRPTIKLTYRQSFGNNKVKATSKESTGAAEERKRVE